MSTKLNISRSQQFIIFLSLFITGLLFAGFISYAIQIWCLLIIVIICIICFFLKQKKIFFFAVCIFSIILGIWYLNYYKSQRIYSLPYGKNIQFIGKIIEEPDVRETRTKLTVSIQKLLDDSNDKSLINQKILIDVCRYPGFFYGDTLKISGKLQKPEIIDSFDYGAYLRLRNIGATILTCGSFDKQTKIEFISNDNKFDPYYYIFQIKNSLINKLNLLFPEPIAGLLNGILFGTKKAIIGILNDKLNIVGLTHVVVVSGYHVVILTQIFIILTKKWPKKLSFLTGTLFLISFSIFVGMGSSVVRSIIVAWLMLFAKVIGRKAKAINVIVITCAAMVIQNPLIVKDDIGFQLSFLSFVGISYVGPKLIGYFQKIGNTLAEIISSTLGAQIMTTPLIAIYFQRISLIAPVTNILIVPFVPIVMLGGFASVIVSYLNFSLGFVTSWPTRLLIEYIIFIINKFSNIPLASVNVNFNCGYIVIVYYLLVIIVLNIKSIKLKNEITN